jgi:hypothetical protein
MATKIFLTSLIVMAVDIIIMKIMGEYQDKWYVNFIVVVVILAGLTAVISALFIIWQ